MDGVPAWLPGLISGIVGGLIALMAMVFRGGRSVVLKPELEHYQHTVSAELDRLKSKETELRREIKRVEDYGRDTYMLRSDLLLLLEKALKRIERLENKTEARKGRERP